MAVFLQKYQILAALALVALAWVLWQLRLVIGLSLAAYIIAAATLPAIDWLVRHRAPRLLALFVVYGGIVGGLALAGVLITIPLRSSLSDLLKVFDRSEGIFSRILNLDFSGIFGLFSGQTFEVAGMTITFFTMTAAAIVLSIYLSYDWHRIKRSVASLGDRALIERVIDLQAKEIGGWMYGQLVLSAAVGVLVGIGLFVLGIPHALMLAIAAALFELVPYIGPVLASLPAVLLAFQESLTLTLAVAALYLGVQQLENHLLVPLIMHRAVRIHPIIILLVVLVGFTFFGVFGALVAVPFSTMVLTTWKTIRTHRS